MLNNLQIEGFRASKNGNVFHVQFDRYRIISMGYSALTGKPSLYLFDYRDNKIFKLTDQTNEWFPVWAPLND